MMWILEIDYFDIMSDEFQEKREIVFDKYVLFLKNSIFFFLILQFLDFEVLIITSMTITFEVMIKIPKI